MCWRHRAGRNGWWSCKRPPLFPPYSPPSQWRQGETVPSHRVGRESVPGGPPSVDELEVLDVTDEGRLHLLRAHAVDGLEGFTVGVAGADLPHERGELVLGPSHMTLAQPVDQEPADGVVLGPVVLVIDRIGLDRQQAVEGQLVTDGPAGARELLR